MLRNATIGVGLCGLAAIIGLVSDASLVNTARLLLVAGGLLTVAVALTKRPSDWQLWAAASIAMWLAWPGLPDSWDSAQMVARTVAMVTAAASVLAYAPKFRYIGLSAFILFHFGNMVTATTLPDSRPWVSQQLYSHVYMPYMRFMYLSNAYHFYSPDPGPASHLFYLITWETDEPDFNKDGSPKLNSDGTQAKKTESSWVTLPRRDEHFKDPLGLGYYRRLSITELVAGSVPSNLTLATFEKNEAYRRRQEVAMPAHPNHIPLIPPPLMDPYELQFRIPRQDIADYMFPSYARHIASNYSKPGRRVVRMKLYRVEHRVVGVKEFLDRDEEGRATINPFTPLSFRPYYLGEYSPEGVLLNPKDPMLYWLTPIIRDSNSKLGYTDYMSKHAGFEYVWKERP